MSTPVSKVSISLGNKVRDRVTGFTGIATSKVEYLNGCVQYCIMPAADKKTGKVEDGRYVDSQQIEILGVGVTVLARPTGGPASDAPKSYRG